MDCGSWDELEVDHVDPALKISHSIWSWSLERRLAELAKCVVRCRACHLKKSVMETSGEQNGQAKLTAADVLAIRASKATVLALAEQYDVSDTQISRILKRQAWKHI